MADSLESLVARPVILDATTVQDGVTPGQDIALPNPLEAKAVAAAFSHVDDKQAQPSILGFAAAGMLLHEIVKDTLAPPVDEEEEEPKKRPDPLPDPI